MLPEWLRTPNPEIYLSNNYVVLDWETTNLHKGSAREATNRIVMGSWLVGEGHPNFDGDAGPRIVSRFSGEFGYGDLVEAIEKADFLVAQNTKFELQWLKRCGLQLQKVLPYDTIIGKYVEDGNRKTSRDLSSLARHYGVDSKYSLVDSLIKGGVCPSEIPRSLLLRYCEQDVKATHEIFLRQRRILYDQGLLGVAFTRNIFTPVLADIEITGLYLDNGVVQGLYSEYTEELVKVERELDEMGEGINWGSGPQVAHFVYETLGFEELKDKRGNFIRNKPSKQFPNGAPKVDKDTLLQLKAKNKKQKRFIELKQEHSKLKKALSTYLTLFKDACDNNGGYLYGNFNQSVTKTHRLSSSSPNFQNFDNKLKKVFTSRRREDGWKIGERDAAQLEFRVAAYLGDDSRAREDIATAFDVHAYSASIIFKGPWERVKDDLASKARSEYRRKAKPHTFKPLFGGTSGTESEQEYYRAFKEKYPGVAKVQEEWVNECLSRHKLVLPTGLIAYYPNVRMTSSGYIEGNTEVRNYPIQNLATAEIIPIGVTYMWHHMKDREMESLLINTVHDSAITDENPEETEELDEITEHAFSTETINYLNTVYGIDFDVPLEIETELNTNWGYSYAAS